MLIAADMNIPRNLEFFRRIIELESDSSRSEILFKDLNHAQQRDLQAIAHSRKLEYEYHRGCARVFRDSPGSIVSLNIQNDLAYVGGAGSRAAPSSFAQSGSQPQEHIAPSVFDPSISNNIPTDLQEQSNISTTAFNPGRDNVVPHEDSTWSWPPLTDPNGSQQQFDLSQFWFQEDSDSDMNMGIPYLSDESLPVLDLRHHPTNSDGVPEQSYFSNRRQSGSSFAFDNLSGLADMPSYEDFAALLPAAPAFPNAHLPATSRRNSVMSFQYFSPVASPRLTPLNQSEFFQPQNRSRAASVSSPHMSDFPRTQNRQTASRSGSVSSLRSDRGRNRISKIFKRSSSGSMYSPGFGENVFDANLPRSASRASSGRGRTGPLDYLARVGMKAVKAVGGACWKCKIRGKKVTHERRS